MSIQEAYHCSLDENSEKKAEKELNERPSERDGALITFRQWIEQHHRWLKCPTDAKHLLGFLRNKKYVQLAARKKFVNYWTMRSQNPTWFHSLDTASEENVIDFIRTGIFLMLPERDKGGRRILLSRIGCLDVSGKFSVDDLMRATVAVIDYMLLDENTQVNGFVFVQDLTGMTIKHQTYFGMERIKKLKMMWLNAYPMRYKAIYYYNTNPIFDAMFALFSPLLPEKLRNRLHFLGKNLSELYKHVDQSLLPIEYLPDDHEGKCAGSVAQIVENMIGELRSPKTRDAILHLSSPEFGVNDTFKPPDIELYTESFRRLNID